MCFRIKDHTIYETGSEVWRTSETNVITHTLETKIMPFPELNLKYGGLLKFMSFHILQKQKSNHFWNSIRSMETYKASDHSSVCF